MQLDGGVSILETELTCQMIALEQQMSSFDVTQCGAEMVSSSSGASSAGWTLEEVRRLMLERVARSTEQFCRFQQRDEPDLSFEDRLKICSELLDCNPASFLSLFGSLLLDCDLLYFDQLTSDCIINFRVTELKRKLGGCANSINRSVVKNRRFEAMRRLENCGEYFSDEEMKKRDPLLYEEMIGQFLTDEETVNMSRNLMGDNMQLSQLLLRHLQVMQNNEVYEQQIEKQESQMEEEEEDTDDDDEPNFANCEPSGKTSAKVQLSECEKAVLRNEFIETMKERFLHGEDGEFDYSEVDQNADYDSVDQLNRDAEDKYFDDDDDDEDDDQCNDVIKEPGNVAEWDF